MGRDSPSLVEAGERSVASSNLGHCDVCSDNRGPHFCSIHLREFGVTWDENPEQRVRSPTTRQTIRDDVVDGLSCLGSPSSPAR